MRRSARKPRRHQTWASGYFVVVASLALYAGVTQIIGDTSESFGDSISEGLTYRPASEDQEAPVESEPVILQAVRPPAMDFIEAVSQYQPKGYKTPAVKNLGVATIFASWECSGLVLNPAPSLGAQIDLGKETAVIVQTYGAGQSALSLRSYQTGIDKCRKEGGGVWNLWSSTLGTPDQGFAYQVNSASTSSRYVSTWIQGDVMVSVASPKTEDIQALTEAYESEINRLLGITKCIDIRVDQDDAARSPYYSTADYQGWDRTRKIELPEDTAGVTLGVLGEKKTANVSRRLGELPSYASEPGAHLTARPLPPSEPTPEAPLPDNMPSQLPTAMSRPAPSAPPAPRLPSLTGTLKERVADPKGPGCGWVWSGQLAPEWDDAAELEKSAEKQRKIESDLIKELRRYTENRSGWVTEWVQYARSVYLWNQYVDKREGVLSQWRNLNNIRKDYRKKLDDYYDALEARREFIEERKEAREQYRADLLACKEYQEEQDREEPEEQETPDPDDGDGTLPPPPDDPDAPGDEEDEEPSIECPPKRPAILDKDAPAKPKPPAKPNVPLPKSWKDIP